ncbi:MAG TPA: MFS transporter, partial [Gemmatimonadaceae bacterium]|nr:MFS transporter [Gemmatimonadaceae bacterium]
MPLSSDLAAEASDAVRTRAPDDAADRTVFGVIVAISCCHLLNDMMQSLLSAIYPNLKEQFGLTFVQVGMVTLAYQITASLLQPWVGLYADKRPTPLALPGGTLFSFAGLTVLSMAPSYSVLLVGACLLGIGSSVFHPESSRVARMAAGERHGLAQALFQVGGNTGQALGPLAAAIVVVRWGRSSLSVFALLALLSCAILWNVSRWYKHHGLRRLQLARQAAVAAAAGLSGKQTKAGILVLLVLVFSKYVYLASLTSYYTFYLIQRFHVSVQNAQMHLFVFLAAVALGTIAGGPIGDRVGRRYVIWFSIVG